MMYCFILILLIAYSAKQVHLLPDDGHLIEPCPQRKCTIEYEPVCGKQQVGNCTEEKIFNNHCQMENANDCGRANYVPCVKKQCKRK